MARVADITLTGAVSTMGEGRVSAVMADATVRPVPVAGGGHGDFDDLYAATFQGLMSQIYAYLGDRTEAQDVVQEAFCRAFARWRRIRGYDDPVAWVRKVAWNLATSRFRKQKTITNFLRSQRQEHFAGPSPDRVALVAALARISAQQRKAVVMHYIAGLSVREIAEQEAVAEGTVKSRLSRGREALNALLAEAKRGEGNV